MSRVHPQQASEGRRIRDDVRDGAFVMALSLAASTVTAALLLVLTRLAG